ncbi:MAG TPA: hypothetical protein VK386_10415, partial [Acidimicrobiales bacterium]|nr:hypothetical protein [Acidimicrobiales bacterium]
MVLVLRDKRRANLRRFGGEEPATPSIWSVATLLLVTICAGVPLLGLRADLIGYDAFSIWTLHAAFFYGGHHLLVSDLKDAAYAFSNPDYPPLIPATGALGYRMAGHVDYRVAVAITAALNAASMGLLGCGVANMWRRLESFEARLVAVVGGSVLCIAGFGIAGQYGVDGYADLLWSAAATTAVVYGLVSPRSTANLFTAVVTATAAALTKNEGLIASVI